jgi:hypothetical protein
MPKLYELTNEYNDLLKQVEENAGEVTPEMDVLLKTVGGEVNAKIENIAKLIKNLEGDKDAFTVESKRLSEKARTTGNHIDWLKFYIKGEMERACIAEVKGEVLKINVRPSPPSCVIVDEAKIPATFIHEEVVKSIDKKAIIANYKDGAPEVPGTMIAIGVTLTIK